jgi:hypothetical protein
MLLLLQIKLDTSHGDKRMHRSLTVLLKGPVLSKAQANIAKHDAPSQQQPQVQSPVQPQQQQQQQPHQQPQAQAQQPQTTVEQSNNGALVNNGMSINVEQNAIDVD